MAVVGGWLARLKPKRLAIAEACVIGLVVGVVAVLLKVLVGSVGGLRLQVAQAIPYGLGLPLFGGIAGAIAGWLTMTTPQTAGSGIPPIKAALGYVPLTLNGQGALVKLLSATMVLGGGFALGRQGPTVYIGAALAAQLSRLLPTSPEYQRQLIAAGAAAGLAAGFNAPLSGVMFVVEELLHDVSSITLTTSILASFVGGVVPQILGSGPEVFEVGSQIRGLSITFSEIPYFVVLGIITGMAGAWLQRSILAGIGYWRRWIPKSLMLRMAIAGMLTGWALTFLPSNFWDSAGLQQLLSRGQGDWLFIVHALFVRMALTLLACSAEAPGGLFLPSLILGSAMGSLVGLGEQYLSGGAGVVEVYALAGMGAFFGAVSKAPITAIMLVFEITKSFSLVLPLMVTVITAYLMAEKLFPGSLYSRLLERSGIQLPDSQNEVLWEKLTAGEVMRSPVETLPSTLTLDEVEVAFAKSHHRGFPVMEDGQLVGIITETDLAQARREQVPKDAFIAEIMTPNPITVGRNEPLARVLYLLSHYRLSRLPVLEHQKLVGIITRSDILRVEAAKLDITQTTASATTSYCTYSTRDPTGGSTRILLLLRDINQVDFFMRFALAIARERRWELECLHVITITPDRAPAAATVNQGPAIEMLRHAKKLAEGWNVPVHTQIRIAHRISDCSLEVVQERNISLMITGWHDPNYSVNRDWQELLKFSPCDLLMIRPIAHNSASVTPPLNRWFVPTAGGPNSIHALELLPALVGMGQQPEVALCQIRSNRADHADFNLEQSVRHLEQRLPCPVIPQCLSAPHIPKAIAQAAMEQRAQVILLGASREGFLHQAWQGSIPEEIARQCPCTIVVFRKGEPKKF